jgi:hypothetical protein
VTVLLDSGEIPAVDRDQAVREAVARMKVPLDIEFPVRVGAVDRRWRCPTNGERSAAQRAIPTAALTRLALLGLDGR